MTVGVFRLDGFQVIEGGLAFDNVRYKALRQVMSMCTAGNTGNEFDVSLGLDVLVLREKCIDDCGEQLKSVWMLFGDGSVVGRCWKDGKWVDGEVVGIEELDTRFPIDLLEAGVEEILDNALVKKWIDGEEATGTFKVALP